VDHLTIPGVTGAVDGGILPGLVGYETGQVLTAITLGAPQPSCLSLCDRLPNQTTLINASHCLASTGPHPHPPHLTLIRNPAEH
jgi:hypothetical protein